MAKPTKGHTNKRPPSDDARRKREHINMLKRSTAIIDNNNVDESMFTWSKVSNNKYRIKGVGAIAYKLSRGNKDVVAAIRDRNWTRVAALVPSNFDVSLDYEPKKKVDDVVVYEGYSSKKKGQLDKKTK